MTQPSLQPFQIDVGTGPNQIVQLDGSGNLPAVGGAALTSVPFVGAKLNLPTAQVFTSTTPVALAWQNSTEFDSDGFFNFGVDDEVLTIPAGLGGVYCVVGQFKTQVATIGTGDYLGVHLRSFDDSGAFTYTFAEQRLEYAQTLSAYGQIHINCVGVMSFDPPDTIFMSISTDWTSVTTSVFGTISCALSAWKID